MSGIYLFFFFSFILFLVVLLNSCYVMSLFCALLISEIDYLYSCSPQKVDAVCEPIFLTIYHALDASLDDEFGTLDTG